MKIHYLLVLAVVAVGCSRPAKLSAQSTEELRSALATGDAAKVRAVVAAARRKLGERAGEPEVEDKYQAVPADIRPFTRDEAKVGFSPHFARLDQLVTWRVGLDPRTMTAPLRGPASLMSGCVAVAKAGLVGAEHCGKLARETAEFLMWAQEQAGAGAFPFPAARGTSSARAMEVGTRFIQQAEKAGKLAGIERNGWVFDDLEDGGLQFDNAECGVAMFDYYEFTGDERALASARKAADWALGRPLVTNWNYNSFSAWLLARAFVVTGEKRYLDAAATKALVGVIPGQLTEGPHAGRWLDAHNARPPYHYIMLRALTQLAAVLPAGDERRDEVLRALRLGLKCRNAEIVTRGVMNKDKAFECLLLVRQTFGGDAEFLRETQSTEAFATLVRLISAEARGGKIPLGPGEWGRFLADTAQAGAQL